MFKTQCLAPRSFDWRSGQAYLGLAGAVVAMAERKKMKNKANFNVSSFLTSKYVGYFKVAVKKSKANPSKGSGQVCQINRFFCKFLPL